ncbi:MAG TPA: GWxTD domain-containing protein, partial [Thermoanaerobaculia bacterium]
MRTTRHLFVAVLLLCAASAYAADGLVKFKGWDATPQGYFMTKAEHQEWSAVRNDEEAQRFIDSYLARRGPAFAALLASRVEQADKHMTIGKIPGSMTLRGKVVILLGVPSAYEVTSVSDSSSAHHDSGVMAAALSGGSASVGGDSEMNEGSRVMGTATLTHLYHFTYASTSAGPLDVIIAA